MRRSLLLLSALLLCAAAGPVRAETEPENEKTAETSLQSASEGHEEAVPGKAPLFVDRITPEGIILSPEGIILKPVPGLPPPNYVKDKTDNQDSDSSKDGRE